MATLLPPTITLSVGCANCDRPFRLELPLTTTAADRSTVTVEVDQEALRLALTAHIRQHAEPGE